MIAATERNKTPLPLLEAHSKGEMLRQPDVRRHAMGELRTKAVGPQVVGVTASLLEE